MRWDLVAAVALGLLLTACEAGNAMPKAGGAQPAVTGTIFAPGGSTGGTSAQVMSAGTTIIISD